MLWSQINRFNLGNLKKYKSQREKKKKKINTLQKRYLYATNPNTIIINLYDKMYHLALKFESKLELWQYC